MFLFCLAKPYISRRLSLPIFISSCSVLSLLSRSLICQPSSFHLNFLPPVFLFFYNPPSLPHPPVFSLVSGGSWEQASCNSRCLHIWTRWWNRGMRLSHDPPSNTLPFLPPIHPPLLPSLFCAIILVQGVPHSFTLLPPFLFSLHLLYLSFFNYTLGI